MGGWGGGGGGTYINTYIAYIIKQSRKTGRIFPFILQRGTITHGEGKSGSVRQTERPQRATSTYFTPIVCISIQLVI